MRVQEEDSHLSNKGAWEEPSPVDTFIQYGHSTSKSVREYVSLFMLSTMVALGVTGRSFNSRSSTFC